MVVAMRRCVGCVEALKLLHRCVKPTKLSTTMRPTMAIVLNDDIDDEMNCDAVYAHPTHIDDDVTKPMGTCSVALTSRRAIHDGDKYIDS